MKTIFTLIGYALILIHAFLGIWSCGGMLEWFFATVPWNPYSNPEFPKWLLFIHWSSVLFASIVFIYGYFTRWKKTPHLMAIAYGLMALVCVIETFGYMTNENKYLAMGAEFTAYIIILIIILNNLKFKSQHYGEDY
ncbi:MAG: hypothetical protein EPN93_00530 [Spirochaetes bacterium]|nr:MAG: hypothetical protein EPN93_00530 [Spirochaetota bacterium]